MSQGIVRKMKTILIIISILAAVKILFVDYTMDEEYQIVMAYRNMSGDTLFGTMWEPHQTSAFVCVWLMQLFRAITGGTTGVVLFLRFVTLGIQAGLTVWLTKTLQRFMEKDYAFLLGCCYFNTVPKLIQIPEFSNLQLWFFTVTVLSLIWYYDLRAGSARSMRCRRFWLLLAGLGMALEVLAYPSSILLFPFFLIMIFYRSRRNGMDGGGQGLRAALADGAFFAGTCGICAAVWLFAVLSRVRPDEFLRNIRYLLDFDLTHDLSLGAESRITVLLRDGKIMLIHVAGSAGIGAVLLGLVNLFRKCRKKELFPMILPVMSVFLILGAELLQLYYWVIRRTGYEAPQIHLLMAYLAAVLVWKQADRRKYVLFAGIAGGFLTILATIYMSNLGLYYSVAHGALGAVMALGILVLALEKTPHGKSRAMVYLLLFSMAFFTAFGKGYTLRAGRIRTVPEISGLIRKGPAAGVFTSYIQAYITNCTYEEFGQVMRDGENCLIVTNMAGTGGTSPYLFRDLSVSHFSIVDPTSYDERLLTYWALYPEKQPDVIVVDCWYGQLMEDPDSWIMQYIEKEFGYTEMIDGTYVRFYRR